MGEMKRALRPLDIRAVTKADVKVPNPKTLEQRKQWMDAYEAAGGKVEPLRETGKRAGAAIENCACIGLVVVDEIGAPYGGIAASAKHDGSDEGARSATTDSDGSILLTGVSPGAYTIELLNFDPLDRQPGSSGSRESLKTGPRGTGVAHVKFSKDTGNTSVNQPEPCGVGNAKEKKLKCFENPGQEIVQCNTTLKLVVPRVKREYIVVVGTEQHRNTWAMKMMFFASAVRDIRALAKGPQDKVVISLIYFTDGYNATEIQAVKESIGEQTNVIPINSTAEFVAYLGKDKIYDPVLKREICRKISSLSIYSHGLPSLIAFGYHGPNSETQSFSSGDVLSIPQTSFDPAAVLTSYACRTGISPMAISETFPAGDASAFPMQSLAQQLADHLRIEVRAWLTRTLYEDIWNDGNDERYIQDNIDLPHMGLQSGKSALSPGGWFSSAKNDYAHWNKRGAYGAVKGGAWPRGLSNSPRSYFPQTGSLKGEGISSGVVGGAASNDVPAPLP